MSSTISTLSNLSHTCIERVQFELDMIATLFKTFAPKLPDRSNDDDEQAHCVRSIVEQSVPVLATLLDGECGREDSHTSQSHSRRNASSECATASARCFEPPFVRSPPPTFDSSFVPSCSSSILWLA